ncbi:hypothetical protein A3765_28635 [Oleiphilus sp. HI0130]|nr:hypothetical protein A3765_28650 [Oleiphilus sp. HI0130]KZZ72520.1 hypothetical protein A3765_28635 [Oleiphilus sp. HI0130]
MNLSPLTALLIALSVSLAVVLGYVAASGEGRYAVKMVNGLGPIMIDTSSGKVWKKVYDQDQGLRFERVPVE